MISIPAGLTDSGAAATEALYSLASSGGEVVLEPGRHDLRSRIAFAPGSRHVHLRAYGATLLPRGVSGFALDAIGTTCCSARGVRLVGGEGAPSAGNPWYLPGCHGVRYASFGAPPATMCALEDLWAERFDVGLQVGESSGADGGGTQYQSDMLSMRQVLLSAHRPLVLRSQNNDYLQSEQLKLYPILDDLGHSGGTGVEVIGCGDVSFRATVMNGGQVAFAVLSQRTGAISIAQLNAELSDDPIALLVRMPAHASPQPITLDQIDGRGVVVEEHLYVGGDGKERSYPCVRPITVRNSRVGLVRVSAPDARVRLEGCVMTAPTQQSPGTRLEAVARSRTTITAVGCYNGGAVVRAENGGQVLWQQ